MALKAVTFEIPNSNLSSSENSHLLTAELPVCTGRVGNTGQAVCL